MNVITKGAHVLPITASFSVKPVYPNIVVAGEYNKDIGLVTDAAKR
jgi:hypothetical protein